MSCLRCRSICHTLLGLSLVVVFIACRSGDGATYRLDQTSALDKIRIDDIGFYGATLPLQSGDRSGADPVVMATSHRSYLASWAENLRGGEGTDYRYFEPIYLTTETGFDFALIPGEMLWLRRNVGGATDAVRESLELKQSRMRVQETFAATPKDQLVRFLRFGAFRFEKGWFERNGWSYGAERGAGDLVYFYAGNPETSSRASEQRIILGLKNEFIILLGACDERDRAAIKDTINRLLNDPSFQKQ